jgi:transposase
MIRRQVTEIPLVKAEVAEHRLIGRACGCGTVTWGEAPAGVTAPVQYGPRAVALGVYLWHGQFLSRDRARSQWRTCSAARRRRARSPR